MAEVVAANPPPAPTPVGPGITGLKTSLTSIEKGGSLSEVLTHLVNEVAQYVDRAAMFIVKGTSAIGWYARGVTPPEAIKQLNVPLSADTVFHKVQSRAAFRGHISQSPGTQQVVARLGGQPQAVLAVPLVLRDKLAAVLYCDSSQAEIPGPEADMIEILVAYAAKTIDLISLSPKPAAAAAPTPAPAAAPRPVPQPAPRAAAPAPAPAPAASSDEGSSTVMFSAGQFAGIRAGVAPPPPARPAPPPPPPAPAAPAIPPEEQKAHDDAKRFARLVVSEIKLYNEAKVNEGRRNKDIYERLKEDIERGRQMYNDRVAGNVRNHSNYFVDELVRILAGGDAGALGPM
jgi:hypothetical protein